MSEITNSEPVPTDVAEVQKQESEPVLPVTEKSPIVMREDGTPDFIASGERNTLDFLLEKYKDKSSHKIEVTKNALESDLKKAYTALDKAQQRYDNAPIGKEDKAESALLQAQQAYDALKQEADFWINLDKTIKETNIRPGDQIANEIREAGDPVSGEELAAMMLANGSIRLTRDSYEREAGSGKEEGKKMFGLFASPAKGGVNIERAGELLMLADLEGGTNFFDQNDPNAGRNAIIDVLSSARTRGDLINYIKANREAMAERERLAEYNEYAAWCEENYHLPPEEYEAYEEGLVRDFAEKQLTVEEQKELDSQIADEIQAIREELDEIDAILAQNKSNKNEGIEGNDESGGYGLREGGSEILQGEQSAQTGRSGEIEAGEPAGSGADRTDGTTQESASGEIAGNALPDEDNSISSQHNQTQVEDGTISESVPQGEHRTEAPQDGGLEEAANRLRERSRADEEARSRSGKTLSFQDELAEEAREAEAYAKENGLWIPMSDVFDMGTPGPSGNEADTYISQDNNIYKVNNLMNSKGILSLLERIALHNQTFPESRYELVGFTGFDGNSVYPILRQRYVPNAILATPEEIDSYMQSLGFHQTGEAAYSNGDITISDLRPRNVLKDTDGDLYVVDADFCRSADKRTKPKKSETAFDMMNRVASEQEVIQAVSEAEQQVDVNPTEAQKEAGNYKKGHVKIDGFDITIEQPTGSIRSGKDADGKEWSVIMNNTYGYIRGTEGVDGDHIDIFLSDSPASGNIYVVDQVNADGSFDEHKVMYGFNSTEDAKAAYLSNYSPGWKGLGIISEVSKEEFKKWVDSSRRKTKPFSEYKSVKVEGAQNEAVTGENAHLLPGKLKDAYASGNVESIANAEKVLRDYVAKQGDLKLVARTYFRSMDNARRLSDKDSPEDKMNRFVAQCCKESLKDKGIPASVLYNQGARRKLAGETTDPHVLDIMSVDPSVEVLSAVIRNPNTGESTLRYFTKAFSNNGLEYEAQQELDRRQSDNEDNLRFRIEDDVNQKFNDKLSGFTEDNALSTIFDLGNPSDALLSAGIDNKPIRLYGSKVLKKMKKHGFKSNELCDLPKAVADPIAVFDNIGRTGNRSILTELKTENGNFLVTIDLGKGTDADFDIVSSVFGKSDNGVLNWINKGLATYINKEKALDYLRISAPIAEASNKEELSSATKVVESFVNPTIDEGKILSAVDELADSLNTPVHIIRDVDDITNEDKGVERQKRRSKGWYDTKTGEIYLVLPNAESIADAQATIFHETVAHKGLRGLLGENFGSTMDSIFDSLPKEVQDSLMNEFGDKTVSGEEYCAHMAETMSDPGIIQKICSIIKGVFRSMGVDLKMSDGDTMYMLWKSKNLLKDSDTAMESMSKISRDQNVKKQAKEYDALFRSRNPIEKLPVSTEKKIDIVNDLQSRAERLYEGYVDRMIAVKKLQDLIVEKTGKPIPDYMNVWMYENTLSSRNTYEISKFKEKHLNPLTASLKRLVEAGLNERGIDTYVIAKHGLERNEYMRMKAVREYVDNLKEDDIKEDLRRQVEGKTFSELASIPNEDLQDLVAKLSNKDYSGLTAIQQELGDQTIDEFISEIESEFKQEIVDLWKKIKAVNDFSLKRWFDSGMINRATYEKIKGMYKNYVPLRGFDKTMAHDVYEYYTIEGNPFNNPLKSAEGRTSRAESPFPHLISMAESAIVGGNKNLMKLHLYRLAQQDMASEHPIGKLSITKQWYVYDGVDKDGVEKWKPNVPEYSDNIEQYRKNIEKHAKEMALLESEKKATRNPSKLKIAYVLLPAEANEHAVGVKLNGEFFQVLVHGNPKVAQAVEGLNDEARTSNKFVKAVAWANRQMAANFTTRNPAFVASNLTWDLIWSTTALSVKEGGKYRSRFMRNIPKASGALVRKLRGKQDLSNPVDIMLNEFLENGGRTGYTALYSVEKYKKDIQDSLKTGKWAKTKRGYNAVLDFMQLPNEWAEDLSRFSTYMTSREEGRTILKSVADAKEVTVNFNRKGSGKYGAGVFKGLILFFNAAVQSLNNAYGLSMQNPAGMTTALAGFSIAGTMIPLILSMLGSDDDREKYNGLPDYVRKNNLCIPLGWCGVDGFLKVPLPIELRAFYGIGDAAYRALIGQDEPIEALCATSLGLLDLLPLNPAGGTSNFTPDAFKPIVESYITNKDFTGKPIAKITPFNEYDPEYQRVYRSTSVIPVKVSEYLNMLAGGDEALRKFKVYKTLSGADILNPAAIEHIFEAYLGGMFTTLNQSFKTFVGAPTGLNDFSWRNVPVLNRFYDTGEVDGMMMKVNEKYFDYLDEMKEAQNVYRKYESMADNSPALESAKYYDKLSKYEKGEEWKRAEFINGYFEEIQDMNKEIKESSDEKCVKQLKKEIVIKKKEMVDSIKKKSYLKN